MKILVNGGLNLSELDGWWAEAYVPEVGWALGDGKEHQAGDSAVAELDAVEADAMYRTLETEVAADFYTREGIAPPAGWVARMRESMAQLTERFSAARTIREYTEEHYIPAAHGYAERSANGSAMGVAMVAWRGEIDKKWAGLRFGAFEMTAVGTRYEFKIEVFAGDLSPESFKVEVYVAPGWAVTVEPVALERSTETGSAGATVFTGSVAADLPVEAYIPRVVPYFKGASVPLEAGEILWQR
jgi:starch phosphorylase